MRLSADISRAVQSAQLDQALRAVDALLKVLTASLSPEEALAFYADTPDTRELCGQLFSLVAEQSGRPVSELTEGERKSWITAFDRLLQDRTMAAVSYRGKRARSRLHALRAIAVPYV